MKLRQLSDGQYALDAYLMRSNSAVSDKSWVAQITGPDPKYRFTRRFVDRERFQSRRTNDGTQTFGPLRPGEIYEYRNIAGNGESGHSYGRCGGDSGFFVIVDGEIEEVEKCEILTLIAKATHDERTPTMPNDQAKLLTGEIEINEATSKASSSCVCCIYRETGEDDYAYDDDCPQCRKTQRRPRRNYAEERD
jgi:hypothetical protein